MGVSTVYMKTGLVNVASQQEGSLILLRSFLSLIETSYNAQHADHVSNVHCLDVS